MKILVTLDEFAKIVRNCECNFHRDTNKKIPKNYHGQSCIEACSGCVLDGVCYGKTSISFSHIFEIIPEPEDEEGYDGEDDD